MYIGELSNILSKTFDGHVSLTTLDPSPYSLKAYRAFVVDLPNNHEIAWNIMNNKQNADFAIAGMGSGNYHEFNGKQYPCIEMHVLLKPEE